MLLVDCCGAQIANPPFSVSRGRRLECRVGAVVSNRGNNGWMLIYKFQTNMGFSIWKKGRYVF